MNAGEMRSVFELSAKFRKFSNLNLSSSGSVQLDQVSLGFSDVGKINAEADAVFDRLDANKDGHITREEFMNALERDNELRSKIQGAAPLTYHEEGKLMLTRLVWRAGLLMKSQVNTIFKGSSNKVKYDA